MHLLEQIAISYIRLGSNGQIVVGLAFIVLGGVIFAATNAANMRMSRMSYLAILALIVIVLEARKFLWLDTHFSIAEGTLWLPVVVQSIMLICVGYVLAYIGVARSLDVIGHKRWAVFAFLPILNIGFGFVPSTKSEVEAARSKFDGIAGPYGVAIIVLLVMFILGQRSMLNDAAEAEKAALANSAGSQTALVQSIIATRGLDFAVESLAAGSQGALPARVDETTVLMEMRAEGPSLVSVYLVEQENWVPPSDFAGFVQANTCAADPIVALLTAGGIMKAIFTAADGAILAEVATRAEDCDL